MRQLLNLYCVILISLLSGCGHDASKQRSPNPPKTYTEAELSQLITPGMSVARITNLFGMPESEMRINDHKTILMYLFTLNPPKEGDYLSGFDVRAEDGKVVQWSPILGSSHEMFQRPDESGPEAFYGEHTFAFFTVSEGLTNALKRFETDGLVDVSSLGMSPDVSVKAQVFAGVVDGPRSAGKSIRLVIDGKDVPILSGFTEKNLGRRMLVVFKNQVVAAPMITTPITYKQFRLIIKDASILGEKGTTN